jgi:hypothetical protein
MERATYLKNLVFDYIRAQSASIPYLQTALENDSYTCMIDYITFVLPLILSL